MKNGVIMQYFEWNLPNDGQLWKKLKKSAKKLHRLGITAVWIPPAYKACEQNNQGYATYDLYDLGEFDQKGSIRTKYGTKKQLQETITELHRHQISVYLDAVMNHKIGADFKEKFLAIEVDPENRLDEISPEKKIEGWTGFDFAERNKKYSSFTWHYYHFTGIEIENIEKGKQIFRISERGKHWSEDVDTEKGNYDFLMGTNIDHHLPEVITELNNWGNWVANELNLDGMRLDAIKHISRNFIRQFAKHLRENYCKNFYFVGEYWKADISTLDNYLSAIDNSIDLFDVPLHYNFHKASILGKQFDLREIFKGSLVSQYPTLAVTFVDNHDSQKGSSLESEVEDWFKPHAYSLILLRKDGYPCLFYGDYYGIGDLKSKHKAIIDILLNTRKKYAYGEEELYFSDQNIIGFVRLGDNDHPDSGVAVVISNNDQTSSIAMNVGANRFGEKWIDATRQSKQVIRIKKDGNAEFWVSAKSISVWVKVSKEDKLHLNVPEILKRINYSKKKLKNLSIFQ